MSVIYLPYTLELAPEYSCGSITPDAGLTDHVLMMGATFRRLPASPEDEADPELMFPGLAEDSRE